MVSIKLVHNAEVRRLQVNLNKSGGLAFSALDESVRNIFPDLKLASFSLSWIDEEGDQVTISSDPEIAEALRIFAQGTAMVRFQVNVTAEDEATKQYPVSAGVIHSHITCDECGMSPIEGLRFKCTVRDDFDLCETCESKKTQPYPMLKIADSRDYHPFHGRRWGRFGRGRCGGRGFGRQPNHNNDEGLVPKVVHFKVRCDECGMSPIEGPRFKCAVREDFDLCESCEALQIQPYPMIKIMNPRQAPKALVYAFHDADNQQSDETSALTATAASVEHPHYAHHRGHGIRHGDYGQGQGQRHHGRAGRGWGGRGGFRSGRGCLYMQQSQQEPQEEGQEPNADYTVHDRPVISSIADALSCLKGLSGYHSVDIPNPPAQQQKPAAVPVPAVANQAKSSVAPVAVSPMPVEVKAKPTSPPVSAPLYAGLPAGVYPFPSARDGIDRRQPSVEGQILHRRQWAHRQIGRHHERREWRRDWNDEDEALQRVSSASFGLESSAVLPSSESAIEFAPAPEADAASRTVAGAEEDVTVARDCTDNAMVESNGVTVETVEENEDKNDDDEDEGSDAGSIVLVDAVGAAAVSAPMSTTAATTAATAKDDKDSVWHEELILLAAMGFIDSEVIIPLLQRHIGSANAAAGRKTAGLQRVVAELLNV